MAIAVLAFAGCKKETNVTTLRTTIQGFHSAKDAKVYIDTAHYACWHTTGDQVFLNSSTPYVTKDRYGYYHIAVAEGDQSAEMFYSIYPASAVNGTSVGASTSVTLPAIQLYKEEDGKQIVEALMAAMGEHRLDFKNLCALLEVTVTDLPSDAWLTKIEVTTTTGEALCGTGNVIFTSSNITLGALSGGTNGGKTIKLQFDNEDKDNGTYYVVIPPVNNTAFDISVHYRRPDVTTGTTTGTRLYTKRMKQTIGDGEDGYSLGASEYGSVVYDMDASTPAEHLPGAFSISDSVQIYFSRGNLKYNDSLSGNTGWTNGWGFERNQYTATPHVQGNGNKENVHRTGYMPMHFKSGWTTPALHNDGADNSNLTDIPALAFGANSKWRLLTQTEWAYLMAHANPTFVTIAGKSGLMLFPDLFQWPVPDDGTITQDNDYTADEWSQLEDAGCVFLISAGFGDKQSGSQNNPNTGYYWSSTPYNNDTDVYYLEFTPSTNAINAAAHKEAECGLCVRLVYVP